MKRAYGTGRIYQPKNCQFWYVQYWQDGKQIRESSRSTTKAVAETLLRERLHGRDNGKLPVQEQKKLAYSDLRRMLLDHYSTKKLKSLQVLADGTETIWGLSALDKFFSYESETNPGNVRALSIDNAQVGKFIRERRAGGVSDATIRGSLALLVQMFSIAKEQNKLSEVPHFTLPEPPKPRKDFVREPQLKLLLNALPEHLRPVLTFLFYQGTRLGEASEIRWNQIDLSRALYAPDAAMNKTGDDRLRPVHDEVLAALRKLPADDPEARVFDTTNLVKTFRRACLKLGLARHAWVCGQCGKADGTSKKVRATCPECSAPMVWRYAGLRLHGFRRSCVVYYRDAGVPDAVIMKITGHKSPSVFQDYSTVDLRAMRGAMETAANEQKQLPAAR